MFKNKQMDSLAVAFLRLSDHYQKMQNEDIVFAVSMIDEIAEANHINEVSEKYKNDIDICLKEIKEELGDDRFNEYFDGVI